jgi:hypothetical protein
VSTARQTVFPTAKTEADFVDPDFSVEKKKEQLVPLAFRNDRFSVLVLADFAEPQEFPEIFGFEIPQRRNCHEFLDILYVIL